MVTSKMPREVQSMKIGVLVFLTEQSGNPGEIAREVENLGFASFFVAAA